MDTMDTSAQVEAPATPDAQIVLRTASVGDLPEVLRVQRDGFGRVAVELELEPADLPPLRESLQDLGRLMSQGTRFFVALDGSRIVGTVRGTMTDDGTVEIGRLAVSGDHIRRGIGRKLIEALELAYPSARRMELYTGREAAAPLALYRSLGYTEMPPKIDLPYLIWLEKPATAPTAPPGAPLH
jgi:ribosomal protein S18 acetylase RimI-like enzyme